MYPRQGLTEGGNVNEKSIRHLVDKLAAARLPIQTFIIDDGWHDKRYFKDAHDRRNGLWSFGAKPEMGAGGLRGIVDLVKAKFESVDGTGTTDVGAWLA